jgi:CheY-like chemotaxis protein
MDTATESPTASILVVEDDPQQVWLYSRALRDYRLTCVSTGTAALESLQKETPDLILLDHVLGKGELGGEFLPRLKDTAAHVPVIMVSGTLDIQGQLKALQGPRSASFVVTKPVDLAELEKTVEIALTECGRCSTASPTGTTRRRSSTG